MTKDKKKEIKKSVKKEVKKKEPSKKEVTKKEVPKAKPKEKTKLKEDLVQEDDGIIVVEDDTGLDKEAELEARKAYLEEARSQEASDD
jgi:NAD kinase